MDVQSDAEPLDEARITLGHLQTLTIVMTPYDRVNDFVCMMYDEYIIFE